MEHTHRDSFYRFCCAGDNRSRATAERGRETGRSASGARSPCRARSSCGSRSSPGARAARGGGSSRGAAYRRATGCPARRCAARVRAARIAANAARDAAAVGPALRWPARLGDGPARADAANCGASAATAANHRPQCRPRWSETRPADSAQPAQQCGAPIPGAGHRGDGGRCRSGRRGGSTGRSWRT
jgi:hypothetical protein